MSLNYTKRTPVPAGSGAALLLDVTEGVDSFPAVSPIIDLGHAHQSSDFILMGVTDDAAAAGNLSGTWEAATNPDGPWFPVATFSKVEFSNTTSDGANTGWFEVGTAASDGAPGKYLRVTIDNHTLTGQRTRFWVAFGNEG